MKTVFPGMGIHMLKSLTWGRTNILVRHLHIKTVPRRLKLECNVAFQYIHREADLCVSIYTPCVSIYTPWGRLVRFKLRAAPSYTTMTLPFNIYTVRPTCAFQYIHRAFQYIHREADLCVSSCVRHLLIPRWRHQMETVSALLVLCARNSPVTGEFPTQRPVTRSFDVFFDLRLNKRLSKQSWGWWF